MIGKLYVMILINMTQCIPIHYVTVLIHYSNACLITPNARARTLTIIMHNTKTLMILISSCYWKSIQSLC